MQDLEAQIFKVAGIGGGAIAGAVWVFRDVIRKNIFPKLAAAEAYRLLRLIVLLAGLIGVAGIGSWTAIELNKQEQRPQIKIDQKTDGIGSPAVISGGDTTIRNEQPKLDTRKEK